MKVLRFDVPLYISFRIHAFQDRNGLCSNTSYHSDNMCWYLVQLDFSSRRLVFQREPIVKALLVAATSSSSDQMLQTAPYIYMAHG